MIRTGRTNPHTLYHQIGEEPTKEDEPLGFVMDRDLAEIMVERHNRYPALVAEAKSLVSQLREANAALAHARAEVQRLQGPVMTPDAKADTEAAFKRGVDYCASRHDKYALNRDGILLLGKASAQLREAEGRLADAQTVMGEAVVRLSEDEPASQPGPICQVCHENVMRMVGGDYVCPTCGATAAAGVPERKTFAAVVTPEEVAAQAADEADDVPVLRAVRDAGLEDCRCDETVGLCRVHDVGRG